MTLSLFEGYGIELELMIVDRRTLDVLPMSDRLIASACGSLASEIERGPLAWSNELVLHVIELKTNGPTPRLEGVASTFAAHIIEIDRLLEPLGGRLMPTGMHPWMNPELETRLWPHEDSAVYESFDRIFGCTGHGWANLQSVHLNLPYCGDQELARLHTAIRLVLPLLPALAASSPIVEGRATAICDNRMEYYRKNAQRIPSITGHVIPELALSRAEYEARILAPIARDLQPHDPNGVLEPEWVNARGAIVRFARDAVEIRDIDVQECPAADRAVGALTAEAVRALVEERWMSFADQQRFAAEDLERILLACIRDAERAAIDDAVYLSAFGVGAGRRAGAVWRHLAGELLPAQSEWQAALEIILERGTLARRILDAHRRSPLDTVYRELSDCLHDGRAFS